MAVLERNRAKLEAKYGNKLKFEPLEMSSMVSIKKPDGTMYIASWNLMTKPPRVIIDRLGRPK
jgi:hypothetical protein